MYLKDSSEYVGPKEKYWGECIRGFSCLAKLIKIGSKTENEKSVCNKNIFNNIYELIIIK